MQQTTLPAKVLRHYASTTPPKAPEDLHGRADGDNALLVHLVGTSQVDRWEFNGMTWRLVGATGVKPK